MKTIFKILSVATLLMCGMGIAAILEYGFLLETVSVVVLGAVESVIFHCMAKEKGEEEYETN